MVHFIDYLERKAPDLASKVVDTIDTNLIAMSEPQILAMACEWVESHLTVQGTVMRFVILHIKQMPQYIEELARKSINECNNMTENPERICPYYQAVRDTTLKSVENFTVTYLREDTSGHSFTLEFDFEANYTDASTGDIQETNYRFNRTAYLDREDGFKTIYWNY